jgi:hypothetical protein
MSLSKVFGIDLKRASLEVRLILAGETLAGLCETSNRVFKFLAKDEGSEEPDGPSVLTGGENFFGNVLLDVVVVTGLAVVTGVSIGLGLTRKLGLLRKLNRFANTFVVVTSVVVDTPSLKVVVFVVTASCIVVVSAEVTADWVGDAEDLGVTAV